MNRRDFRIVPRFPRTADEAFRTADYATAIHRTQRPLWRRLLSFFLWWT